MGAKAEPEKTHIARELKHGKPLIDVYDFHWYSEATDGSTRITNLTGSTLTDAQVQAACR